MIRYPEKREAPAGEALKHFIFVAPEGAVVEEEKKETESLVDAPIALTVKVPGQRAGLDGVWRVGEMEQGGCRRAGRDDGAPRLQAWNNIQNNE